MPPPLLLEIIYGFMDNNVSLVPLMKLQLEDQIPN